MKAVIQVPGIASKPTSLVCPSTSKPISQSSNSISPRKGVFYASCSHRNGSTAVQLADSFHRFDGNERKPPLPPPKPNPPTPRLLRSRVAIALASLRIQQGVQTWDRGEGLQKLPTLGLPRAVGAVAPKPCARSNRQCLPIKIYL